MIQKEQDGIFHGTASGEWIPDGGACQREGYDENGLLRSLNGRLTGVHKLQCSAAEIACEHFQFLLDPRNAIHCFVFLETIRTGMMRVINITVKTEET